MVSSARCRVPAATSDEGPCSSHNKPERARRQWRCLPRHAAVGGRWRDPGYGDPNEQVVDLVL